MMCQVGAFPQQTNGSPKKLELYRYGNKHRLQAEFKNIPELSERGRYIEAATRAVHNSC